MTKKKAAEGSSQVCFFHADAVDNGPGSPLIAWDLEADPDFSWKSEVSPTGGEQGSF